MESGEVRLPEPFLALAMQHLDPGQLRLRARRRSLPCRRESCRRSRARGRGRCRSARRAPAPSARGSLARCTSAGRPSRASVNLARPGRPMIVAWSRRSLATAISRTGSTCWPTCPRSSVSSLFASPRTAAPRRGSATPPRRSPSLRSRGRRRSCRTSARRSRRRSSRSSRRATWRRSPSGAPRFPARSRRSCGCRGSARRRRRRIWRELGVTTLAELKTAAEGEQLRTLSGMGAATEAKILKALAEGQGDVGAPPRAAREGAAGRARGGRGAAGAPVGDRRLRGGQHAPPARDLPRPRRDRDRDRSGRADRVLRRAPVGARGRRSR